MDRFMRPSGVAYLVVAVVLIGLLVGLPSWAAKSSANRTLTASAAVPVAPKEQTGLHTPAAHPDAAHTPKHDDALFKRGQQMFGQYCASCHGESGKGDGPGGANLTTDDGAAQRIKTAGVTHGLLSVFGLKPAIGRDITPEEDRLNGDRVLLGGQAVTVLRGELTD